MFTLTVVSQKDLASGVRTARSIAATAEAFDGAPPVSDQAFIAASSGARELFMANEVGAGAIGFGILGEREIDVVVLPEQRRHGVGTALANGMLTGVRGPVRAWVHGSQPDAEQILSAKGFSPVRTLLRMTLDPLALPATFPLMPAGVRVRTLDPSSASDVTNWVDVNAAAFASHPEQGRITVADFERMTAEDWFDQAELFVLETDDITGFAGYGWVKTIRNDQGSAPDTELYALGVSPEAAGRGFGRLLLSQTLAQMSTHHPASVSLYVDGENTRAVDLYERHGFTVAARSAQWLRPETNKL
ncbi:mycothiol synthase [Leucobacter sp. 1207-22]|uniref:mycothiol synthase n=1 Tax=Leucobacter sp. 1207-22 TaxID=2604456 RepID=UPI004064B60A